MATWSKTSAVVFLSYVAVMVGISLTRGAGVLGMMYSVLMCLK